MHHLPTFTALLLLCSCNPGAGLYDGGTIAITARVINPRPIIRLGDSIAFYFEIPDSVMLNGTRIAVSAGSKDGATIGFDANKIKSSSASGFQINPQSCQVYANPGSLTANKTLFFINRNGKLLAKYYLIPKQKGIYFFDQRSLGYTDLNNRNLLLNFSINFGNIDRSHQLLIDSAGAASRFDLYLKGRNDGGLEVYGFRVI